MPPPLNHPPQDINRTTIQPRPQSVAFSYLLTRERICRKLTKVNNPLISDLLSVSCQTTILQLVKPAISVVNKINPLLNLFCFAGGGAELYLCSLMINKDIHIGVLGGGQLGGRGHGVVYYSKYTQNMSVLLINSRLLLQQSRPKGNVISLGMLLPDTVLLSFGI